MDEATTYERRFRRAGLPLFIEGYSATEDIFTRALPFLSFVFIVEMLGALNFSWGPVANVFAVLGGVALLLIGFGVANRIQDRPFRSMPARIGKVELAVFVLVPPALPLVFGGQWRSALVTAALNLLILGAIYLFVGYGVLSILWWAGARLFSDLAASFGLLVRALPMLMIFSLVLFFTTEMWQVFSTLAVRLIVALSVLLFALAAAFMLARIPREVTALEREAGTGPPLTRKQRTNVGLVMFIAQALQVLIVTVAIGVFFVLLGVLAVPPETQEAWIGGAADLWWGSELFGIHVELTEQLVLVAGGIAAFSGLYFAIAVLTDSTYREEFLSQITGEMRKTFRQRAEYLRILRTPRGEMPTA